VILKSAKIRFFDKSQFLKSASVRAFDMNEFEKIFNDLGIDKGLLPILFRSNRSVIHKYLSGESTAPASALSLLLLIELIEKRNPELLDEWAVLSVPREVYLEQPDYYKGWTWATHKLHPKVLEFLRARHPEIE